MKSFQIIDDQFFSNKNIVEQTYLIVGATILDFAKRFIFQFQYQ